MSCIITCFCVWKEGTCFQFRDWISLDCWSHFSVQLGSTIRTKKYQVANILMSILENQGVFVWSAVQGME